MAAIPAGAAERRREARPNVIVRYASFEARIVAAVLDALVALAIAALLLLVGSVVVLLSSEFERVDASDTALFAFFAIVGCIVPFVLLYTFVGYVWKGQTIGLAIMQIMVIRSDGRPLGVVGAMARVIGLLAYPLLLGLGGLGAFAAQDTQYGAVGAIAAAVLLVLVAILMAAFDGKRRMLHDRLAGTIVVRVE